MYSVEDLLISHGYKLPQSATPTPAPTPTPTPNLATTPSPAPYGARHGEVLENRVGHGPANGYGQDGAAGHAHPPANDNDRRDRSQLGSNHGDTHSLGDSMTSDSGFSEGPRGVFSQSRAPRDRDLSYWRRRGQDFTVLLDYADFREPRGGGGGGGGRTDGQQQRGQDVSAEEHQRERQRWANQAQAQTQAQTQARSREREAALHQWRMAAERKCQSLGADEWRPASGAPGRPLQDGEAERWALEQLRRHARTPESGAASTVFLLPRANKAKSQSLPRMAPPADGHDPYRRVNGLPAAHPPTPDPYGRNRWPPENGRPASANQAAAQTPKPRFSRPLRPPSYEVHQQTRGSCEMLSADAAPPARDRTPVPPLLLLPLPRAADPRLDYFAQEPGLSGAEPPGYIPPPSYRRAPVFRGGGGGGAGLHRGGGLYGDAPVAYQYRGGVVYQQVGPDGAYWYSRHPGGGGSWPEPQRERSGAAGRRHLYPGYGPQLPAGAVQYIPFDDPRVRHISASAPGNAPPTADGADKARHDVVVRHHHHLLPPSELPSVTVSEPPPLSSSPSCDDSAFLPPPSGRGRLASPRPEGAAAPHFAPGDRDDNNNSHHDRWRRGGGDLHKDAADDRGDFPETDQNCNDRYPKAPPPAPPTSRQGALSETTAATTVTQVKKIAPDASGSTSHRSSRRRVSETIFCLVSVPIQIPANKDATVGADQNNNSTVAPSSLSTAADPVASQSESKQQQQQQQSLHSQSLTDVPARLLPHIHVSSSSSASMRNAKRAPLRKEVVDAWSLQASSDKELCYAGSWPGDQYRNQETQTTSPPAGGVKPRPPPPASQSPEGPDPGQPSASTATSSSDGAATDAGSYGPCPMTGQKNLHPSSNSAFSRLSISPALPLSLPPPGPAHPPGTTLPLSLPPPGPAQTLSLLPPGPAHPPGTALPLSLPPPGPAQPLSLPPPGPAHPPGPALPLPPPGPAQPLSLPPPGPAHPPGPAQPQSFLPLPGPAHPPSLLPPGHAQPQSLPPLPSSSSRSASWGAEPPASPSRSASSSSSRPPEETAAAGEQVAFGQFLLKPVSRRPWDAIEELESINKELQDQMGKRSGADAHPDGLELGKTTRLEQNQNQNRPSSGGGSEPSWEVLVPDRGAEGRSLVVSVVRTAGGDVSRPGPGDYAPLPPYRQDIPVPRESLLRDVGLTVYTEEEAPGGLRPRPPLPLPLSRSPPLSLPLSLSLSAPPDQQGRCHPLLMSWESRLSVVKRHSEPAGGGGAHQGWDEERLPSPGSAERERRAEREAEPGLNLRRARSESSRWSPGADGACPYSSRLARAFTHDHDDDERYYAIQDPPRWGGGAGGEATLADRHLETLLIQEKAANAATAPAEDLSNLYEVKCAKGIPENESIEQRAARILGISVPVGALGDGDRPGSGGRDTAGPDRGTDRGTVRETDRGTDRGTQYVSRPSEQVAEGSSESRGQEAEASKKDEQDEVKTDVGEDDRPVEETREGESQPVGGGEIQPVGGGERNSMVLDLPEFPPSKLPLSLPVTPDQGLSLSAGRSGATEALSEDNLTSSSSLSSCSAASPVLLERGGEEERDGEMERGGEEERDGEMERGREERGGEQERGGQDRGGEVEEGMAQVGEEREREEEEETRGGAEEEEDEDPGRKETEDRVEERDEEEEEQEPAMKREEEEEEEREPLGAVLTTEQAEDGEIELRIAEEGEEELQLKGEEEEEEEKEVELKVEEEEKEVELKVEEEEKEVELKVEEEEKEVELKVEEEEKEVELRIEEEEDIKARAVRTDEEDKRELKRREPEEEEKEKRQKRPTPRPGEERERPTPRLLEPGEERERRERPTPRPRPHKPALLPKPKPRSGATVAKREITLPLSFSTTCSSASLEDDELHAVSDSYDPSRVERV